MPEATPKRGNIFQFVLLFLAIYIGLQLVFGYVFPQQAAVLPTPGPLLTASSSFTLGNHPVLTLQNRPVSSQSFGIGGWIQSKFCSLQSLLGGSQTSQQCAAMAATFTGDPIVLKDRCPKTPIDIFTVENPGTPQEKITPVTSSDLAVPCDVVAPITP